MVYVLDFTLINNFLYCTSVTLTEHFKLSVCIPTFSTISFNVINDIDYTGDRELAQWLKCANQEQQLANNPSTWKVGTRNSWADMVN